MKQDRYSRQLILPQIGIKGQELLSKSSIIIIGCGATGSVTANNLTRAGVGNITILDRDIVELNNLQRQTIYDEEDIEKPKALAMKEKLVKINSEVEIISIIDNVNYQNVENFIKNKDLVLDCTDNMETRFLINDICVKNKIPWIYCGAIETYGMSFNILPNKPCFRCLFPNLPPSGLLPTCDTVGVLNTIPQIIASIQSTEAMKILLKKEPNETLIIYDVWNHSYHNLNVKKNSVCKCCKNLDFKFLNSEKSDIITLCGRNAFMIMPSENCKINISILKEKLAKIGEVETKEMYLYFKIDKYNFTIFNSGRAIISGADNEKIARSLYSRYIGS